MPSSVIKMTSLFTAILLTVVVFLVTSEVEADSYPYYFGISGDTVTEIKKYDTLKTDITNTLNKYTKPKAPGCKNTVTQQSFYKDGFTKITNKINEATTAIQKVDKDGQAEAKKCTGPDTNPCVQKATKTATNKLNNIKKPAIQFIKDTKRSTLSSVKNYMKTCTK